MAWPPSSPIAKTAALTHFNITTTYSEQQTIPPPEEYGINWSSGKEATSCPYDWQMLGAGFSEVEAPLYFQSIRIENNLRGNVLILVSNAPPYEGGTWTGYAQCLMRPSWSVASALKRTGGIKPGDVGVATAWCPRDTVPLGAFTSAGRLGEPDEIRPHTRPGYFVTASHPISAGLERGWTSRVYYKDPEPSGAEGEARTVVSCLNIPFGKAEEVEGDRVSVAPGTRGLAEAVCPQGMQIAGGGFSTATTRPLAVEASQPITNASSERWRVIARNTGTENGRLQAFAFCIDSNYE